MKLQLTVCLLAGLLCGTAQAQSIVSRGVGLAHDCYLQARTGRDPRGGIETCDQAILQEMLSVKDKAATYDNRGVMHDALNHTQAAAADFNTAIRLDPNLGDPYVNLGSMLIKQRQYGPALERINQGLALGMGFPHIGYYDRAVAEEMLGRAREAYYDYKKVLEIEPHYDKAEERLKDFTVTTVKKTPG